MSLPKTVYILPLKDYRRCDNCLICTSVVGVWDGNATVYLHSTLNSFKTAPFISRGTSIVSIVFDTSEGVITLRTHCVSTVATHTFKQTPEIGGCDSCVNCVGLNKFCGLRY
jgi:hypothetical protein